MNNRSNRRTKINCIMNNTFLIFISKIKKFLFIIFFNIIYFFDMINVIISNFIFVNLSILFGNPWYFSFSLLLLSIYFFLHCYAVEYTYFLIYIILYILFVFLLFLFNKHCQSIYIILILYGLIYFAGIFDRCFNVLVELPLKRQILHDSKVCILYIYNYSKIECIKNIVHG